ncbi:MAG: Tim44-like domain protein [Syntrophaceae bacterium PtaU1.Bin231]|nr:MAG: Tim44-like domain protein [Syntrophaceae bacterium PtaU1.Bin231]HOG17684.1 Tim44 domain-containing protein [Syntrophales bacterium]
MFSKKIFAAGIGLLAGWFMFFVVLESSALARVGGGRSFGSRGSRSFSAPRPAAPAPVQPATGAGQQVASAPTAGFPQQGGFLRSMAGGLIGGMAGAMLFRSLGIAGESSEAAGGGIGMLDIALIALLLYLLFSYLKKRRQAAASAYYQSSPAPEIRSTPGAPPSAAPLQGSDLDTGIAHIRQMDPSYNPSRFLEECTDLFFKIQAAWTQRDMSAATALLTAEMLATLEEQVRTMRKEGKINRLENIAVRSVDLAEAWQEGGQDFVTVKFLASLLDYTVDEKTGRISAGTKDAPIRFEEYWTFTRPVGKQPWKLAAIQQPS